jgi:DNA-directed RNA polymerase subunit RPC12/RpoP
MTDESNDAVMICGRRFDGANIPGTIFDHCSECGEEVSIAPSGQRILAERDDLRIVCMNCGYYIMEGESFQLQPLNEDQNRELADAALGNIWQLGR